MIRLIHLISRRKDIEVEDFRAFWHGAEYERLLDELSQTMLTAQIRKNLTLDIELNQQLQEDRSSGDAYDAVLEIIWPSGKDVAAVLEDEDFNRLYQRLSELQHRYIDFVESRRFFTEYTDEA